jgi:carbamoyltransferase
MTAILGISAFYHDSAAALIVDGKIVAAAQEERFTRKKHDSGFPENAIEYCLAEAGLKPDDLDYVGFYDKPLVKFERLLETYLAFSPKGLRSWLTLLPNWLRTRLHLPRVIKKGLGRKYSRRIVFPEHHESHAASAFFPSPFPEAAILTVDGVGEWATASYGWGKDNRIELTHEMHYPHSLGLLYTAFTYYCGFRVNSGEYKLMGLAPYGEPKYTDRILEHLVDLKPDGSLRMQLEYFNYCQGLTMTSSKFHRLFDGPPRAPESPLTQKHMDIAASIQAVTENSMLKMAHHVHQATGMNKLCLAGGVALNCVSNGRILREGPFDEVWIQPAAGDAGGALGVALLIWHQLLDNPRPHDQLDYQGGSDLGPEFSNQQVQQFLDSANAVYQKFDDADQLCHEVAKLIADENVIGWMQGRMEFGPRALGRRSILGDARSTRMQSVMNLKIKFRESFRPFAPSVLEERVDEYFDMRPGEQSPYMLLVADVKPDKRLELDETELATQGLDQLKIQRSHVPAITHVDNSARVQTVDPVRHGRYYQLIKAFEEQTGSPVLINTSFNVRGEPIVCTPEQAYRCFMATNMDVLVIEDFVLKKQQQPDAENHGLDDYLARFELD